MNKDHSLKQSEPRVVLLMCGNDDVGKKSICRQWMIRYESLSEDNKTFYKTFSFCIEEVVDGVRLTLPVEIRVMNGDEIETDLKINSSFFKGALGAFVVTSIEDFMSFQDGIKWKEKIDIMCCLPNKFPLPIFLLINKCDRLERVKRSPWVEKVQLDSFIKENQFFNNFFISAETHTRESNISNISNQSVDIESPFKSMIQSIMQFKDIKEKLISKRNSIILCDNLNLKTDSEKSKKNCLIL